jgi:pyridoxamine 5'-phosphate oxidase family protein
MLNDSSRIVEQDQACVYGKELAYIQSQPIARLATVSPSLQPDVAPVGFQFYGETLLVSRFAITRTFKYKNVKAGNEQFSLVIDDLASVPPWITRGIKIHGSAENTMDKKP